MNKTEEIAERIRQTFPGAIVEVTPPQEVSYLNIRFDEKALGLEIECVSDKEFWVTLDTEAYVPTSRFCAGPDHLLQEIDQRLKR